MAFAVVHAWGLDGSACEVLGSRFAMVSGNGLPSSGHEPWAELKVLTSPRSVVGSMPPSRPAREKGGESGRSRVSPVGHTRSAQAGG